LVHPTQEVEAFGNISSPLCTMSSYLFTKLLAFLMTRNSICVGQAGYAEYILAYVARMTGAMTTSEKLYNLSAKDMNLQ